jgi:uncharacterized membrane protein (DUF4010 family)
MTDVSAAGILVAALGGLAIGIERQWSGHASGPEARFAGIRTFTMLGAAAGMCGWLWAQQVHALAIVLLACAGALVVAAYVAGSRTDVDGTTEVGAIVVLASGVLAGLGVLALASGIVAVTTLILVEKSSLHSTVARLDNAELRAAARFAVMAVVILPLLPAGPYGPLGGIRPRELWMLVLFFSGLSFAGYVARRSVGAARGYPIAGLFGGLISSTNVTLTFARASRPRPTLRAPLAYGVVAACTMSFVRVLAATMVLNLTLAGALLPHLLPPFVLGAAVLLKGLRTTHAPTGALEPPSNPLSIREAVQMAVLFQVVLFGVAWIGDWWGNPGVVLSGIVLGLTDVDALTLSMARGAADGIPIDVAARAVTVGVLTNTVVKLGVAMVLGRAEFRWLAGPTLAAMAAALGISLVLR